MYNKSNIAYFTPQDVSQTPTTSGSVRFTERNHSIEIERLTVVPKFQNQGIGSKLLSEIEVMEPNAQVPRTKRCVKQLNKFKSMSSFR
ncbi:GNAT family N-acetyltransferase [uncultured Desulfobulbus sp.]|uniref:GNAT family N-acetyltransferase n=1 Tax=uncultured Desulfobulbus sp. TaxID=239745 RepID=UPI00374D6AF9